MFDCKVNKINLPAEVGLCLYDYRASASHLQPGWRPLLLAAALCDLHRPRSYEVLSLTAQLDQLCLENCTLPPAAFLPN